MRLRSFARDQPRLAQHTCRLKRTYALSFRHSHGLLSSISRPSGANKLYVFQGLSL